MEDRRPTPARGGVFGSLLIYLVYGFTSFIVRAPFREAAASIFVDGILRIVFGTAALLLFVKRFQKGKWTNVIHFGNFKAGLFAGVGCLLFTLFLILQMATGARSLEIPPQLLFAEILFHSLATGFIEEMVFRAYLMEGYYSGLSEEEWTWKNRLYYSVLSALIFGAGHMIGTSSPITPVFATAFGFALASAYLYSHNILVCMLLHFLQSVFAHCRKYAAEWEESNRLVLWDRPIILALCGAAILIGMVYVMKEPVDEGRRDF